MLTKEDIKKLVGGGLMAYCDPREIAHKNEKLLTEQERAILELADAQKTRAQLEAEMLLIWQTQLSRKQIAARFGVTQSFVENLIYSRKRN